MRIGSPAAPAPRVSVLPTVEKIAFGRLLRRHRPTARLLTECRVATLARAAGQPEFQLARRLAPPGGYAVDVGASVGNYALALARSLGRGGAVLALEPNPDVYAELVNSTWGTSVITRRVAASSRTGVARFHVPRPDGGSGHAHAPLGSLEHPGRGNDDTFDVPTATLDELVGDRPVGLVMIDVEGHEHEVLAGAQRILSVDGPPLVVEIEARHLGDRRVADVVEPMLALGYRCAGVSATGLVPWARFDVGEHQRRHLSSDGTAIISAPGDYVNNFVFWRPSDARAAAVVASFSR